MYAWSELTKVQQAVLIGAAESATLTDLLALWEPGSSWTARAAYVPRLAEAIVQLARGGLVEVYAGPAESGAETGLLLGDEIADVVSDPRNWGFGDHSGTMVELLCTDHGSDVLRTSGPDVYGFRQH